MVVFKAAVLAAALLPLAVGDGLLSMPLQHRVVRPDARGRAGSGGAPAIPKPIRRQRGSAAMMSDNVGDDGGASDGARRGLQAGGSPLSPRPETLGALASEANGYAYYATVHLGDPAVAIGVDLDTGSASLAVPSVFCENCAVDIDNFNPQHSRSAVAMSCDDTLHCDNAALLWSKDCVADMDLESSPDMDDTDLQPWKTHQPGWMAPTFRRVRLLFDHGSCAAAAAISGLFTVDAAEPTIAGQPHYTQVVCETKSDLLAPPGADDRNCTTYHLHYREDLSETSWPWVIATWDRPDPGRDEPGSEAQDHMDIEQLARFAADMAVVRAGLSLGEAVLAQCLHPTAGFQASSLAVRAYTPYGPASCCAEHSHACLHSDYYKDGSGTTGPVYYDTIRVGDVSHDVRTHGYFKAFEDDEGGVASGGHFTSSHSSAGIWGLAPEDRSSLSKRTGVKNMGSVLSSLLLENGLADAFALCFDDSPAAFSDGDSEAASSLDLGGPDARKYHGAMQFLPLLRSSDGYFIGCNAVDHNPMSLIVGDNMMDPTMDAAIFDPDARQKFKRIQIDSGTATTLSLPQAIQRALGRTILNWFRAEYDLSSGAAATAANVATQLFSRDSNGCIALSARTARTVALFPTLTLGFTDTRGQPLHISLPPTSYLEIWPEHHALCLLIDGNSDPSTGMLAAGFLRRYYTLFDRQNARIGMAERGDCNPDEPPTTINSAEAHCAARASQGCASCAGPIDDLELDKGYCTWCPSTASCHAYDPRSVTTPCVDLSSAQGWDQATLDAPPGGHCPELSTMERTCQAGYMKVTDLAMRGNVEGTCSAQAQQAIASYAAACEATTVRMHLRGKTVELPGSDCLLSVLAGSTSVHGLDHCTIPPPLDATNRGCNGADHSSSCAYEGDGECDAGSYCPDGSDLSDCYGSKTTTSCTAHAHAVPTGGCMCDAGFTITAAGNACESQDSTVHGAGNLETHEGNGPNSCWWANDGECDGADSCAPGTDTNDCNAMGGATNHVPSSVDCPAGWIYDPVHETCDLDPGHPPGRQGAGGTCPPHSHADAGKSCTCDAGYTSVHGDCEVDARDCGEGVQTVNDSCPPPDPGLTTPSSCPGDCAAVFVEWWNRCSTDESIIASVGEPGLAALRAFNSRCIGPWMALHGGGGH